MSQFRNNLIATSTLSENKMIYDLGSSQISFGEDFMCYDHFLDKFCVVIGKTFNCDSFKFDRFETNFDIPTHIFTSSDGSYLHAVAIDEAISPTKYPGIQQYNYCDTNYSAAEYCFYRIEVNNNISGGFDYSITTSNATSSGSVSWNAGDTVESIKNQIMQNTAGYIRTYVTTNNPVILENTVRSTTGEAIGIAAGGYGNNVCSISNIVNNSAEIIDMSKFAVISNNIVNGDSYDSSLTTINSNRKNWRGSLCQTCVGSTIMPYANNTSCLGNSGYNYSYRTGVKFLEFINWARSSGNESYTTDGVNGTTNNSSGVIMKKTYFDNMMNSSHEQYNSAMHSYYNNLLNSDEEPYKTLRKTYSEWYNYIPTELYDVYIMTHMIKLDPTSGIGFSMMNKGKTITDIKGKIFTVTFNYTYVPAYPPEYNALRYGRIYNTEENTIFKPGFYYHPEPLDLGIIMRDDMIIKCNTTWNNLVGNKHSKRTNLSATGATYLGSVGECNANYTWNFYGYTRCLDYSARYNSNFRSRPCSAYKIN
ncbi:MAG: hypothetical protein IKO36_09925 [Bacteroidaceae bacterium]|nr:hypothetical protein [Bacteroidaceae bacterium]